MQTSDYGSSGTGSNLIALMDVPAKGLFYYGDGSSSCIINSVISDFAFWEYVRVDRIDIETWVK